MKYRIEYNIIGVENTGSGANEFEAETNEQAISNIEGICLWVQTRINRDIKNRYWDFRVRPSRLVRIEQPEISTEIEILS